MDESGPGNHAVSKELKELRDEISALDEQLFTLFFQRMTLAEEVAKYKANLGPVRVPLRENELVNNVRASAPLRLADYASPGNTNTNS